MLLIPTLFSAVLGFVFILLGATAIWLIFEASRHSQDQVVRNRRIRAHRIAGYLFIALFCFMTWFMLLRLKDTADELALRSMLHILKKAAVANLPTDGVGVLIAALFGLLVWSRPSSPNRQGQCGTCATGLLRGQVQMDYEDGLDSALKAKGYVLTCVARAKGDVQLDA